MTDQLQNLPEQVSALNELPLSKHVKSLFAQAGVKPESGLLLCSLGLWSVQNDQVQPTWAEAVEEALANAQSSDPRGLYWNLQSPEIEQATFLGGARKAMLRRLADLIPADSQAA